MNMHVETCERADWRGSAGVLGFEVRLVLVLWG